MSKNSIAFINDFFNDLQASGYKKSYSDNINEHTLVRTPLHKVRNGKSWLWYCPDTETYWRSLKACKNLSPASQRVNNPKFVRT